MNFLQLTNDFIVESGACEPVGSVVNQFDEQAQAVIWVRDAWIEIQRNRLWRFRWAEDSFSTVLDQTDYTLTNLVRSADDDINLNSFTLSSATQPLTEVPYPYIKARLRAFPDYSGMPKYVAQRPDDTIVVYPPPDGVYTLDYEYFKAPVELTDDTDSPTLNPKFHKVIVWKALEQYAREQGKEWAGLYQAAIRNYNSVYSKALEQETGKVHLAPSKF
jgi:hypothetical protein